MSLIFTNVFIYAGILLFTCLMLAGLGDFSVTLNFLDTATIDVRLLVMFFLAEPHFAMTLPLLYGYRKNFYNKPTAYIYAPLGIIFLASILFFYQPNLFFLVFLIANIHHVNRQSVGFLRLQTKLPFVITKIYEANLHIVTAIGLYLALIKKTHSIMFALVLLICSLAVMGSLVRTSQKKWPSIREISVFAQGYFIFLPILIFEDILLAFAVGISIHYLQYMFISWNILTKGFGYKIMPLFLILVVYTVLSTGALGGFLTQERMSIIVFIPTLLQLLHFYYDGFLWKRSDELVAKTMKTALSA